MTFTAHTDGSSKVAYLSWPLSRLDRDTVADATSGSGWSIEYDESPDHQVSLMILPISDDSLSTFVISGSKLRFRLAACDDDVLCQLGEFQTMNEAIIVLRCLMANQTSRESARRTIRRYDRAVSSHYAARSPLTN
jgi:hypothetical protein